MEDRMTMYHRALNAPGDRLNWRPAGVTPYESLWSILHKLVYLNDVSGTELCKALASPVRGFDLQRKGSVSFSLHDFGPVSRDRLRLLLKLDRAIIDYCVTDPYRGAAITNAPKHHAMESKVLRYCRLCIAKGFHSPLFQLLTIARCPIHDELLATNCPRCRAEILYQASGNTLAHPYRCPHCRDPLWPGLREPDWAAGINTKESQLFARYIVWISEVDKSLDRRFWSLGFESVGRDRERTRLRALRYMNDVRPLEGWGKCFNSGNDDEACVRATAPSLPSVAFQEESRWGDPDACRSALISLIPDFYRIYKCVRRYLQRRFLRQHVRCRRLSATPGLSPGMDWHCPWVDTFRLWRHRWERSEYWFEHANNWEEEFVERATFLREVLRQLDINKDLTDDQRSVLGWIGGRWVVFLLLATFKEAGNRYRMLALWEGPRGMPFLYWRPATAAHPHEVMWWSGGLLDFSTGNRHPEHRMGRARYRRLLRKAKENVERLKRPREVMPKETKGRPRKKSRSHAR